MPLFSDDFTRANENPLAAPWVKRAPSSSTYQLSSNKVICNNLDNFDTVNDGQVYAGPDYEVAADVIPCTTGGGASGYGGVIGRRVNFSTNNSNYYAAMLSNTYGYILYKMISGTPTSLGSGSYTVAGATAYTVALRMIGTTISLRINGVQQLAVTDSALSAAGNGGLINYADSWDNYVVTDFNVAGQPTGRRFGGMEQGGRAGVQFGPMSGRTGVMVMQHTEAEGRLFRRAASGLFVPTSRAA